MNELNSSSAKPSQAKPSQAKPSQAKPSQAKPSLVSSKKRFFGVLRLLAGRVIPETSDLYKFLYFNYISLTVGRKNRKRVSRLTLQVVTTDICNLNCKHCGTYSPIVQKPYMLDVPSYRNDIARLANLLDGEVEKIEFSGGEILMHPDASDILTATRESFPDGTLCLITNGTLLHKMDENFWRCCHDSKTIIQITPYPIRLNYSRILELASQYQVEVICYVGAVDWYKDKSSFRKLTLSATGDCNVNRNFRRCTLSQCQMLRGSRIYRCNAPAYIGAFNEYFGTKFEVSKRDYVDVYEVKNKEEIFDFLTKPIPFCRYCDMDNWKFGIPWGISKKEISEWM